jgi:hypothetical protein
MACADFDGQLVRREARVLDLLDKFVCVRLVQANALDLSLFQFDYDLTFAAFFLNADKTLYGRFGSRSHHDDAQREISMEGFRKAMEGALALHAQYPANQAALAGKQGRAPKFKVPEEYPALAGKYQPTLDYEGKVARSCLHCHQVREAERLLWRTQRQLVPDDVLYPWPMPNAVGLALDPKEKAKVTRVQSGSAADQAGFQSGDEILSLNGQPLLSIADVQWVLHTAGEPAEVKAVIQRKKRRHPLTLKLAPGWRRVSDISWRATTWDLRRMATGGLKLEDLPNAERRAAGLSDAALALRVEHVGEYGEHAVAKRAGFKKHDVIVAADGLSRRMTESELIGHFLQTKLPATRVPVTVLRAGERLTFELPMQ